MNTLSTLSPRVGDNTRWGRIQAINHLAPGIVSASTAGHGGVWISPDRELSIPANVRAIAREYAPSQWYEEDCDCCIVALWFAHELEPDFVKAATAYVHADPRMQPLRIALAHRAALAMRLDARDVAERNDHTGHGG